MGIVMLAVTFLAALAVAGGVVLAFAQSIDQVLTRLVPDEMLGAWSRCAKFAVFVVGFIGGLRLQDLSALLQGQGGPALNAPQALLEVMKSVAGGLESSAWVLVAFFVAALLIHAGRHVYGSLRAAPAPRPGGQPREGERTPQRETAARW